MQGKDIFAASEIEILRLLIKKYSQANTASDQKEVRKKLRKIGFYVSDFGIQNITSQDFESLIKTGKIRVLGGLFTHASQPVKNQIEKPIPVFENTTKSDNHLEEELIQGSFKKVGIIDNLVPDQAGFYCIRLANGSNLPERYQIHLKNRKHRIIYIGKAEGQSLKKRFLGQELRARGHGTFFRSIGAVLGLLPEKGSLLIAKNKNNYTFKPVDESKIITWINQNLEVNWVVFSGDFSVERDWIQKYSPLLNDTHNPHKLDELREDKAYCRAMANC
ncbi:MAG: hypothetical protein GZ091_12325 [Paludibacter sp.]|nr:hypothetical protein [Paludibacter sp.]